MPAEFTKRNQKSNNNIPQKWNGGKDCLFTSLKEIFSLEEILKLAAFSNHAMGYPSDKFIFNIFQYFCWNLSNFNSDAVLSSPSGLLDRFLYTLLFKYLHKKSNGLKYEDLGGHLIDSLLPSHLENTIYVGSYSNAVVWRRLILLELQMVVNWK